MSPLTGYERMLELARRESELLAAGRWDEASALWQEREALQAVLPSTPPPEAGPLLEETLGLVRSSEGLLAAALAETGAELRRLGDGRRAAQAYSRSSIPDTA